MLLTGCWDYPVNNGPGIPYSRTSRLALAGWALAEEGLPCICATLDGLPAAQTEPVQHREDIAALFFAQLRDERPTGWAMSVDLAALEPGAHEIVVTIRAGEQQIELGRRVVDYQHPPPYEEFLSTLVPILRCPQTGGPVRLEGDSLVSAQRSSLRYPARDGHVYLESSRMGTWAHHATSVFQAGAHGRAVLREAKGAVLILGAGMADRHARAIQLDIFDYPNIDVVSDGGALPFLDNSLAGVVCEHVIEHVPDPAFLVREIERVLEPGGLLGLVGANMYFTHGFPSHYFNPTRYGMQYLLETLCRFEGTYDACEVTASMHAIVSHYYASLDEQARQVVGRLTVAEFVEQLGAPCGEAGRCLAAVSPTLREALSINVMFFGAKKA